jgi:hypothetical protein
VIRRSFRIGLWLGLLVGLGYAVMRFVQSSKSAPAPAEPPPTPAQPWTRLEVPEAPPAPKAEPAPAPAPAPEKAAVPKKVIAPWVDPSGGVCPPSHPVKAKLSSKIFQVEGNLAYDRTKADRCYKSPSAAEKDGFRAAKK